MKQNYKLFKIKTITDERGKLSVLEGIKDIPFEIKRVFYMHNIMSERGGHAHIDTDQIIIAIHGTFDVQINNGISFTTLHLDNPELGLYIPKLTFVDFLNISTNAVCLVLANSYYDITKSLRSLEDFNKYINENI